jgi:hypothetical protein
MNWILFFSGMVGLWPIWGILTPIYMVILFMGYSMSLMFLPDGLIGTLLSWVLTISIACTSHYLPHTPDW